MPSKSQRICVFGILAIASHCALAADAPAKVPETLAERNFLSALREAFRDKSPEKLKALCCWDDLTPLDEGQWNFEISDLAKKTPAKIELRELGESSTWPHRSGNVYYRPNLKVVKEVDITLDDSKDRSATFKGGIGAVYGIGMKAGKLLIAGLIPINAEDRLGKPSGEDMHGPGMLLTQVSYSQLGRAEWRVEEVRLGFQPVWNPLAQQAPFSPEEAAQAALKEEQRRFPDVKSWIVTGVGLHPVGATFLDRWYYQVELKPSALPDAAWMDKNEHWLTTVFLLDKMVVPQEWLPANQPPPAR